LVTLREAERSVDSESSEPFDYRAVRQKAVGVGVALPDFDTMLWPKPDLLRNLLDEPVVALVEEARLGKTTVAHLLAFWRALWSSGGGVQTLRGTSSAPAAVATAVSAPGTAHEQLVIEDPYGPHPLVLAARHDAVGQLVRVERIRTTFAAGSHRPAPRRSRRSRFQPRPAP
jgi:hypothetical protein